MKNNGVGVERRVAFIGSETRYRRLFETAQDGILILDAKTEKITDVNPFLIKMLGYSYEEFLGKKLWETGPFKDVKASRIAFKELQEKDYIRYENLPLETKNGQRLNVEFVSNAYLADSMRVIQCNIRDITKRVQAETTLEKTREELEHVKKLARSNEALQAEINARKQAEKALNEKLEILRRLATVVSDSNDAIILHDLDGKILAWNRGAKETYGYTEAEALGKNVREIVAEPDRKAALTLIQNIIQGETVKPFELRRVTRDGRILDVWLTTTLLTNEKGEPVAIATTERDITARKLAETAIKEKMEDLSRLATVVSDSNDAIILHDLDGKILAWNRGAKETYGYTEAEALGKNVREIVAEPDRKAALTLIQNIIQGETVKSFELRRVTRDGRILDVWLTTTLLTNEKGEPVAISTTERDITAQKLARELARQEIIRSEALERTAIRLNAKLDPVSVINTVCEEAIQALNVPAAWVNLYDRTRDVLVLADAVGLTPEFKLHYQPLSRTDYEKYARELGSISVYDDIQRFTDIPNTEVFASIDARTLINASMYREGQLIGTLHIVTIGEIRQFNDVEITLIKGLAAQAAQAIANAQLYEISNQRLKNLDALRIIDMAIAVSHDLHLTLNIALEQIVTQLRIDAADVLLLNPFSKTLEFSAGCGFYTRAIELSRVRLGEGIAGRAALDRNTFHSPAFSSKTDGFSRTELLSGEDFVDYLAVPLITKGEVKGVLEIFHRSPLEAKKEWKEFLETLGGQVAIAVESAQLFQNLQRSNADLVIGYDATIESLSQALDLRDKETEGHSTRVTEMTVNLALMKNMSDLELIQVRRGSLLHDIGKLGVPDEILLKPGPLTEKEWVIMKQHVMNSFNILSPIVFLRPALDIPYCHHEKWDGSGYPRGLKGEQIPMSARLFAVVDVYDALTNDRTYRPAWTREKTLEQIKHESGTHFDPQVVDLFLRMMDKPTPDPFSDFSSKGKTKAS